MPDTEKNTWVPYIEKITDLHKLPPAVLMNKNKGTWNTVKNHSGNGKPVRGDNWKRFFGNS